MGVENCPVCVRLGKCSPLIKIQTPIGTIQGMCSSYNCSFPFTQCSALSHSIIREQETEMFSKDMDDFIDQILTDTHSESVSNANNQDNSNHLSEHCKNQSELNRLFTSSMLPRYLADDMKRIVNSDCERNLRVPNLICKDVLGTKTTKSFDSGLSMSSFSSLPSTPVSYTDYVRTNQRAAPCPSEASSTRKTPTINKKCAGNLDQMVKLYGQRIVNH